MVPNSSEHVRRRGRDPPTSPAVFTAESGPAVKTWHSTRRQDRGGTMREWQQAQALRRLRCRAVLNAGLAYGRDYSGVTGRRAKIARWHGPCRRSSA